MNRNSNKRRKRGSLGLKWKIFGFFTLFTLIILIILWLIQTVFLSDIYRFIKMSDLKKSASEIETVIESDQLGEKADSISKKNEMCILVETSQGVVLASSDGLNNCVIHHISYRDRAKLYLDAKAAGGQVLERFVFDSDRGTFRTVKDEKISSEENMILTRCVSLKNGEDVVIFINVILTPVGATVKTLNTMLGVVSVILMVIALALSLIISTGISKPIKKLTASAGLLAAGNYDADFDAKSSKEINALADTLKYASSELKKNEALKRELIANISHDLRTPLTLITGYGEVMRDIPNEMTTENLQIIIDESKRLSSLVDNLLDVSKLQSNTVEPHPEIFDMTELVRETADHYRKLVEKDNFIILFSSVCPGFVNADRQMILQVVYNLLNNAVNHTGKDMTVTLSQSVVLNDGVPFVRIEVSDTGEGIAKEDLPYIWDRYYKVDKFHNRDKNGSGLGLSIVKSIVELHGGRYGVFSSPGFGSTFWFELPEKTNEAY